MFNPIPVRRGCITRPVWLALCALLLNPRETAAQPPAASAAAAPFAIADNSFLVEEAFNQEKGVFQNIFGWTRRACGAWEGVFTQEWPVFGMTHQVSYTLPFSGGDSAAHLGGVLVNYRLQVLEESSYPPGFLSSSERHPADRPSRGRQRPARVAVNLPFSKQAGDVYVHWNAGVTWTQGVPLGVAGTTNLTDAATVRQSHLADDTALSSDARKCSGVRGLGGGGDARRPPTHAHHLAWLPAVRGTQETSRSSSAWRCRSAAVTATRASAR